MGEGVGHVGFVVCGLLDCLFVCADCVCVCLWYVLCLCVFWAQGGFSAVVGVLATSVRW